jgi:hypothetical protein
MFVNKSRRRLRKKVGDRRIIHCFICSGVKLVKFRYEKGDLFINLQDRLSRQIIRSSIIDNYVGTSHMSDIWQMSVASQRLVDFIPW